MNCHDCNISLLRGAQPPTTPLIGIVYHLSHIHVIVNHNIFGSMRVSSVRNSTQKQAAESQLLSVHTLIVKHLFNYRWYVVSIHNTISPGSEIYLPEHIATQGFSVKMSFLDTNNHQRKS